MREGMPLSNVCDENRPVTNTYQDKKKFKVETVRFMLDQYYISLPAPHRTAVSYFIES